MCNQNPNLGNIRASRDPPERVLTLDQRKIFRDAYPDPRMCVDVTSAVEKHAFFLIETGKHEAAREFIEEHLSAASLEAKRLATEKRRAAVYLVSKASLPAVVLLIAKAISHLFHAG